MRIVAVALVLASLLQAGKKNPDDVTQVLALPKDPPAVAVGETRKLVFHVSPMSGKGLLSQQTREALKAILKLNGGAQVIHVRAFVAGSGDIRRVPQIVSEVFTEKKQPLPSVSVVLAGGLPVENAQVLIESVSVARKDVASGGFEFASGDEAVDKDPGVPVGPLLSQAVATLAARLKGTPVRVSCFVTAPPGAPELAAAVSARFPGAAVSVVMTQRGAYQSMAKCEGVARTASAGPDRLAFSGTRVAFGSVEKDAALAFQRLDRDLAEAGAGAPVYTNIYPVNPAVGAMAGAMAKKSRGDAPVTVVAFEGVASNDAGFAVDAVSAVR
jgi:enamine deaminase RidA (YjgF/YER057c/UK114 family)